MKENFLVIRSPIDLVIRFSIKNLKLFPLPLYPLVNKSNILKGLHYRLNPCPLFLDYGDTLLLFLLDSLDLLN